MRRPCPNLPYFYFVEVSTSPTLWAGTNSGQVLVFVLEIPEGEEKRKEDKVGVTLGKEIQLKHRAPVLGIQILDASCVPVWDREVCSELPFLHFMTNENVEGLPPASLRLVEKTFSFKCLFFSRASLY